MHYPQLDRKSKTASMSAGYSALQCNGFIFKHGNTYVLAKETSVENAKEGYVFTESYKYLYQSCCLGQ